MFLFFLLTISYAFGTDGATFPDIDTGDLKPNDERFGDPIGETKDGELTIASFNIRNMGNKQRSLDDFEALVDLMNEADVILIQEAGLGIYDKYVGLDDDETLRMEAIMAIFEVYFGDGWDIICPIKPSGSSVSAEAGMIIYREKSLGGFRLDAFWNGYVDLGNDKRDMATFALDVTKGKETKTYMLGSVHLKPEDPHRGAEMQYVIDWLLEHGKHNRNAIVMGDYNWGYKKVSKDKEGNPVTNYLGENRVIKLHKEGKLFQLFSNLSYLNKGDDDDFRTNMGYRKSRAFYDQFLTTPPVASQLADGGKLQEDCGFIAFGLYNKRMKKVIADDLKARMDGLNKYIKAMEKAGGNLSSQQHKEAMAKVGKQLKGRADDNGTYKISDHRLIWMQIKP
ncbi:MAG: hypothetical protein QNK37_04315 [Acidobacteriota bacterium]|nr:hypothetical protein [Acidobacteriota bacterium]